MNLRSGISVVVLTAFLLTSSAIACVPDFNSETAENSDSNLIFRYGVGAKNELNTFKGTYTKDMILDPSITIRFSLTEGELDSIYDKMVEIGFFDYPDQFSIEMTPGELVHIVTPASSYYFKVEYKSQVKELVWDNKGYAILNEDEQADKLRELIRLIRDIIEAKEEYQRLPKPRGGYM